VDLSHITDNGITFGNIKLDMTKFTKLSSGKVKKWFSIDELYTTSLWDLVCHHSVDEFIIATVDFSAR